MPILALSSCDISEPEFESDRLKALSRDINGVKYIIWEEVNYGNGTDTLVGINSKQNQEHHSNEDREDWQTISIEFKKNNSLRVKGEKAMK